MAATDDMDELVIRLFRDVIDKGKAAIQKGEEVVAPEDDSIGDRMSRAGRAIVKEGERAVKKIISLWKEEGGTIGDAFRRMITEPGELTDKQRNLEALLYDFEDFIDADSFEAERFKELQAASKSLALAVIEAIRRLAVETPPTPTSGRTPLLTPLTPSMFPPLPPLPPLPSHMKADHGVIKPAPRPISRGKEVHPLSIRTKQPRSFCSEENGPIVGLGIRGIRSHEYMHAMDDHESHHPPTSRSSLSHHSVVTENLNPPLSDVASTKGSRGTRTTNEYPSWRNVDLTIGPNSTFAVMKGFCEGATGFRSGGHWDGVMRYGAAPGAQAANAYSYDLLFATPQQPVLAEPLAKCIHCEYSHKYDQMSEDVDRHPGANLVSEGVRFRRRFLYKSHMATRDNLKACYACLFCERTGSTVREDDPTVFTSITQLMRHVARHPRPLPAVPGLAVIYGTIGPDHPQAQDYDVNLANPSPEEGEGEGEGEEDGDGDGGTTTTTTPDATSRGYLPVAVAVRDHVAFPNERKLSGPDRETAALSFLAGARIVAVEFPEKWGGKWCVGWHDGRFGAFPAKMAQLEAPRRRSSMRIEAATGSRRSGVTKWKWEPKETSTGAASGSVGWLAFDKGEQITHLDWDDPDAWYWLGTNSKGKYGIFPRSHMKIESIQDGSLVTEEGEDDEGSQGTSVRRLSRPRRSGKRPTNLFGLRRLSSQTWSTSSS
ncbi:hypothetical protein SODALDRAFT_321794 [Sodiomyces alkalinus F11]|uniref:SH3 domain-containing protein n=1 Tax=Sodiomyces alkalinus (strain CBS 110278 / VKM F-3762 / F11) TaxID=1314773 RepID=A0A3N2Q107_SODAK|nr:hypothetical protein SODALDRAFT_321794 [Sodiomyces alkalinus F11]ROT40447.1 hypothetical protein SODALDRAFT_321794 [Sodiomyces alkalinus F11]